MDRERLYDRINKRVDMMFEEGLVEEVKSLIDMGLKKDSNAMKSIGYAELYDFCKNCDDLNGESVIQKLENIKELIKQHSRNYAKRQITWFKAQKNIKWVNVENI